MNTTKKIEDNLERVDLDKISQKERELMFKQSKLLFKLNHIEPMTEEYTALINEMLDNNIDENSTITIPFAVAAFDKIKIRNNAFITTTAFQWKDVELP